MLASMYNLTRKLTQNETDWKTARVHIPDHATTPKVGPVARRARTTDSTESLLTTFHSITSDDASVSIRKNEFPRGKHFNVPCEPSCGGEIQRLSRGFRRSASVFFI